MSDASKKGESLPMKAFCILCHDIDRHLAFYVDTIGLKVQRRDPGFLAFFTKGTTICLWEIGHIARHVDAFGRAPDVDETKTRIRLARGEDEFAGIRDRLSATGTPFRMDDGSIVFTDPNACEWEIVPGADPVDTPGIVLYAKDISRSTEFYAGKMGLALAAQGDGWADFTTRNGVTLHLRERSEINSEIYGSMPAIGFDTDAEVFSYAERLIAAGVKPASPVKSWPWNFLAVYFSDPDGHIWEVYSAGPGAVTVN